LQARRDPQSIGIDGLAGREEHTVPRVKLGRYSDPLRSTRTRAESSRLIGCGASSVDELMDRGVLSFVEFGNRRQPTVASLERLLGSPIAEIEARAAKDAEE
jgi:hypothetical protein